MKTGYPPKLVEIQDWKTKIEDLGIRDKETIQIELIERVEEVKQEEKPKMKY